MEDTIKILSKKNVKKRPLTFKQKAFIKEYIQTGNATESANKVYNVNNRVTAGAVGAENLQKPQIKQEIEAICNKAGLTKERITQAMYDNITDVRVQRLALELLGLVGNTAKVLINNDLRGNYNINEYVRRALYSDEDIPSPLNQPVDVGTIDI